MMNKINLHLVDTEKTSLYDNLEQKSITEILYDMNTEDKKVAEIISTLFPDIEKLVSVMVEKVKKGGRIFYVGAGTSGRLGVIDASEILPTFGVDNLFIGLIAGGDGALRRAVEGAEDDREQCRKDIQKYNPTDNDILIGIAASGRTPYVIGGLEDAKNNGLTTGCIVCSLGSKIASMVDYPLQVPVGPEYITGSTRLKSGTAQKLVLNQLSTATMISLGYVTGSVMTSMTPTNEKLKQRAFNILIEKYPDMDKNYLMGVITDNGSMEEIISILSDETRGSQ